MPRCDLQHRPGSQACHRETQLAGLQYQATNSSSLPWPALHCPRSSCQAPPSPVWTGCAQPGRGAVVGVGRAYIAWSATSHKRSPRNANCLTDSLSNKHSSGRCTSTRPAAFAHRLVLLSRALASEHHLQRGQHSCSPTVTSRRRCRLGSATWPQNFAPSQVPSTATFGSSVISSTLLQGRRNREH